MATILGTNNSETLSGTANADLLQGLAGNDTLNAAVGDDSLDGGAGNDSLVGGVGSDSYLFNLGDGADIVDDYNNTGIAETNVIKLGVDFSLADVSISQEGNGHMVIRFANSPADSITLKYHFYYGADRNISKVVFSDNSELDISVAATSYTLNRVGTVGNDAIYSSYKGVDSLKGGGGDDSLAGGDGNDKIWGEEGNDVLWGDAGNDMLFGGLGNDSLNGGVGSDTYMFNKGDGAESIDDYNNSGVVETNVIQLGAGFSATDLRISMEGNGNMVIRFNNSPTDSITIAYHYYYDPKRNMSKVIFADNSELDISSTSTAYTLNSTATVSGGTIDSNYIGTDVMMGDSGNDTFYSNAGNDLLKGNDGHDYLNGENGNDELWGGQGNDTLRGGEGDDVLNGEADNDEMSGQNGNDTLNGGSGNDTLYGGDGNDTLIGGAGIDVLDGGVGDDTYYVDSMHELIRDYSGNNTVVVGASADNYYAYGDYIQNVIYESAETLILPYFIKATLRTETWGSQWATTGANVTYSFVKTAEKDAVLASQGSSDVPDFQEYNDAQKANARSALDQFASFSGLSFTEVNDSLTAQIRLMIGVPRSNADGPGGNQAIVKMRLGGANGYFVHAHELTHALGMGHTFEGPVVLPVDEDSCDNSNVSYTDTPADLSPIRPIPMFDVATIQYLYGVNHSARAGNDVYTQNDRYIWDGAGIDTLSLTTAMQGVVADLRDGAWDYVGLKSESILADGQFYIGVGTDIENAIGSQWNDTLLGNELDNLINGGLGNDILDGRLGNDTDVCNGLWQNYTVTGNATAATVVGGDGADTLFNIENICFNNVTVSIADAVNDNPIGVNDTNSGDAIIEASPLVIGDATASGNVLDNDTDADSVLGLGETKIVSAVAGQIANVGASIVGVYGSVVINANGSYLYTLNNNDADTEALNTGQTVSDNFSYTVIDAHGATGTATLSISVAGTTDRMLLESAVSYTLSGVQQDLTLTGTANINGTGNSLDNIITGNNGNNILNGKVGADTLIGGLGNDTYYVDNIGDVVTENVGEGTDIVYATLDYALVANVENVLLLGTANLNSTGNELKNSLVGNSGNNNLSGGLGNDALNGGLGADTLTGGLGDDTYYIDNVGDVVTENLGEGTETVYASISYGLTANVENLGLLGASNVNGTGNELNNSLTGNSGNNILNGGVGKDTLIGGLGDDTYYVDNTTDVITEQVGAGTDTVYSTETYTLAVNIENVVLQGTANINGTGNALDNVLTGNAGNNSLNGSTGVDTVAYGLWSNYSVVGNASNATVSGVDGTDTLISIENLKFNGVSVAVADAINDAPSGVNDNNGSDAVIEIGLGVAGDASAVGNVLSNDSDADEVLGLGETKTVSAVAGQLSNVGVAVVGTYGSVVINANGTYAYTLDNNDVDTEALSTGQSVTDSFSYSVIDAHGATGTASLVITLVGSTDRIVINSGVTYTLATGQDDLVLTGISNINGTGNSLDNIITGNSGNNILDGKAGADTLIGGLGNDTYYLDNIGDVVTENIGEGTDIIFATIDYSLAANVENLLLRGVSNLNGTGNELNNSLTGNNGNNALSGGLGSDVLNGGLGVDTLMGGLGNDIYYVDQVGSEVSEGLGEGSDIVYATIDYSLTANVENLLLRGVANVNGTGNELNNSLTGNTGNNALAGGLGNDTLNGGLGNDSYSLGRGEGQDTVVDSSGTADVLSFLSGIAREQLWFKHSGNNLEVSIIGTTDKVTVNNWYVGGTVNQVEEVHTASGNVLFSSQVESLVTAMASFTPPSVGTTTLNSGTYASVLSVIAANWS